MAKGGKWMAHAILRGANGRRHDVEFEDADITVEIFFSDETVEIAVESPHDVAPSDKRRFALLSVPRRLFNKALGDAARRSRSERQLLLDQLHNEIPDPIANTRLERIRPTIPRNSVVSSAGVVLCLVME
jgi:hypothetical protein